MNYELALTWGRTDAETTLQLKPSGGAVKLGTAVQEYCVRVLLSYDYTERRTP